MDCGNLVKDIDKVVCALQHPIASPNDFWTPLIASVLGALVGAFAVFVVFLLGRKDRQMADFYRRHERNVELADEERSLERERQLRHIERFDIASADAMRALASFGAEVRRRADELHPRGADRTTPDEGAVLAAFEIMILVGGPSVVTVVSIMAVAFSATNAFPFEDRAIYVNSMISSLRLWRLGSMTDSDAVSNFQGVIDESAAEKAKA